MKVYIFPRRQKTVDIRGRITHRVFGLATMWRGEEKIVWRKCHHCSGGTQALSPLTGTWGPIPPDLRREQDDRTGYPQANIRECYHCHGVGKHWVPDTSGGTK